MIILTAGHTGPNSGAQCAATQFDEGAETIWLRNRVAEILTNKYGLVVLMDDDTASLKLLTKVLSENMSHTEDILHTEDLSHTDNILHTEDLSHTDNILHTECTEYTEDAVATPAEDRFISDFEQSEKSKFRELRGFRERTNNSVREKENSVREKERSVRDKNNSVSETTFLIDLHFNAHSNPNARGTEAIVADDATELELRIASRLAHTTADSLEIPLRGIKSESQTPHRRLAMLHLTPQSIILEVCFCTSPEDVEAYRRHRRKIASTIAKTIAELVTF